MSVGVAASSNWYAPRTSTVVPVNQPLAQAPTSAARAVPAQTTPAPTAQAPVAPAGAPAAYHELVTRYCVTCHNARMNLPVDKPLLLDSANLDNPGKDAATWERVVRKSQRPCLDHRDWPSPGGAEIGRAHV